MDARSTPSKGGEPTEKSGGGDKTESFFLISTLDSYEVEELSAKQFASFLAKIAAIKARGAAG